MQSRITFHRSDTVKATIKEQDASCWLDLTDENGKQEVTIFRSSMVDLLATVENIKAAVVDAMAEKKCPVCNQPEAVKATT